jgi:hypothetical protein
VDFELDTIDISAPGNDQWSEAYHDTIPVIHLNGKEIFRGGVSEQRLRSLLQSESDAMKKGRSNGSERRL